MQLINNNLFTPPPERLYRSFLLPSTLPSTRFFDFDFKSIRKLVNSGVLRVLEELLLQRMYNQRKAELWKTWGGVGNEEKQRKAEEKVELEPEKGEMPSLTRLSASSCWQGSMESVNPDEEEEGNILYVDFEAFVPLFFLLLLPSSLFLPD